MRNKEDLILYARVYYQNNKEKVKQKQRARYAKNRVEILEKKKEYYVENVDLIKEYKSEYGKNNRSKINLRRRYKIKNDVIFMLRCLVAPKIRSALKKAGTSKNNNSVWKHLSYSPSELKTYLESQFEPWMTWNNYGAYNRKTWKDDDITTWTWSIDHIIPQSKLSFMSMKDDNFKKCWALANLRPYSAKQNIIDGNRKRQNAKS